MKLWIAPSIYYKSEFVKIPNKQFLTALKWTTFWKSDKDFECVETFVIQHILLLHWVSNVMWSKIWNFSQKINKYLFQTTVVRMKRMLFGDYNNIRKGDITGAAEFLCKSLKFMDFFITSKGKHGGSLYSYALFSSYKV